MFNPIKFIVTFHMKSGQNIIFKCKNIEIQKKGNELVGYHAVDTSIEHLYFRLDSIDAITFKKTWF